MPKLGVLPKKQVSYKAGVADLAKIFLVKGAKFYHSSSRARSKKCRKISVLQMMNNEIPHETHRWVQRKWRLSEQ